MSSASQLPSPDHASAVQVLAEHYQKTSELTYALRQERDRFFLYLLGTLAAATLFNFDANSSNSLLISGLSKFLGDENIRRNLNNGPFLEIVETLLLAAVFYLMGNLYHRTASVLRNFHYLGKMELEIRDRLGMGDTQVSFSREGKFYWRTRQDPVAKRGVLNRRMTQIQALNLTKYFYAVLLAGLLLSSFALRVVRDVQTANYILAVIDALIGIPTAVYWWNYMQVSREFDTNGASS